MSLQVAPKNCPVQGHTAEEAQKFILFRGAGEVSTDKQTVGLACCQSIISEQCFPVMGAGSS